MTAPDNRDLTKPKVAPFSNSWRTGAYKKGSFKMNALEKAFKEAEERMSVKAFGVFPALPYLAKSMGIDIPLTEEYPTIYPAADTITHVEGDPHSLMLHIYEHAFKLSYVGKNPNYVDLVKNGIQIALSEGEATKSEILDELKGYLDSLEIEDDEEPTTEADDKIAESSTEVMAAKERIVKAVEAAAADTANADNCIADYHYSVESADEDGKDIKKLSIVFEN